MGFGPGRGVRGLARDLGATWSAAFVIACAAARLAGDEAGDSKTTLSRVESKAETSSRHDSKATPSRVAMAEPGAKHSDRAPAAASSSVGARLKHVDPSHPIARALDAVAEARSKFESVEDYTCTFYKRERIKGRLTGAHIMSMKARTRPHSIYFRFQQPSAGREAIYIAGRNRDKVLAHDVGLGRLIAGTLHLDPTGAQAMEDCRHPITEAGIGRLIEIVWNRWSMELNPDESDVSIRDDMMLGDRACTMIESTHNRRKGHFLFHKVRLYIDQDLGLPIRFEGYDWPDKVGGEPVLAEEYTYMNLRLNVGLKDRDFDTSNPAYQFGRF